MSYNILLAQASKLPRTAIPLRFWEKCAKLLVMLTKTKKQKVIKEVVTEGDDENKILGLNYEELIPVLIKAIQEQNEKINALEKEIISMKSSCKQK